MIYTLPFIAAFIGWFTNYLAVKMLFHPRKPIRFLGMTIQGIFPKRQELFAQKLGVLVSKELISIDELVSNMNQGNLSNDVLPLIEKRIDQFIQVKLKEEIPLLSMFIKDSTIEGIKSGMIREVENMLPEVMSKVTERIQSQVNVEQIVFEKVKKFSSDKLEEILYSIMKKEFMFIEVIGAVLGFIIGIIQILITYL
ncbi:MAG: DUF445 family protein [Chitinophagaceae bacterium]|nr:MAG: hypothetical protein UZ11_BCD004000327 [Bacteroidetes bacterium OLB11]MCC6447201.1 DUF445 family protein [Chitinophagaceae bacterium]HMN33640.1 DUF445 family protein [Chitinophagaceae bacterium]